MRVNSPPDQNELLRDRKFEGGEGRQRLDQLAETRKILCWRRRGRESQRGGSEGRVAQVSARMKWAGVTSGPRSDDAAVLSALRKGNAHSWLGDGDSVMDGGQGA